jgi:hypothetical protein
MKILIVLILTLISSTAFSASKVWDLQNNEIIKKNVSEIISSRLLTTKFKADSTSITLLRHSRSGIATYLFNSVDSKFRGEAHCQFSGLLLYKDKVTNNDETCFLINMYESDSKGLNGIGRQVGIY